MKTINSPTEKKQTADEPGVDIPILQDRFDGDTKHLDTAPTASTDVTSKYPSGNRSNPFLPYDTLEKLAAERVQFQQQLAGFDHYFIEKGGAKRYQTDSQKTAALTTQPRKPSLPRAELKTESIQQLVKTMTQSVMAEYAAEIEMEVFRRVKTKLLGSDENGSKT